jgi:hypothetical protein
MREFLNVFRMVCLIVLFALISWCLYGKSGVVLIPEVGEILYSWGGERSPETVLVGRLKEVHLVDVGQSRELDDLVDQLCRLLQTYSARRRPALAVGLDAMQKGTDYSTVLYQVGQGGIKSSGLVNLGVYLPNSALDKSKVYALLPLVPAYDCDLVRLAYSGDQWVLRDEANNERIPSIACRPKDRQHWIVEVEVSGNRDSQDQVARSIYDAMDRLSARYPKLRSFRTERQLVDEKNRNIPPQAQVAASRAEASFVLKISAN